MPVGFPLLERIMAEVLSGIRRFQSHRPPDQRLPNNLVLLHVRPPWMLPGGAVARAGDRLAPAARGLGIEHVLVRGRVAGGPRAAGGHAWT